ncbi:unnamed protein product [[Actinomadura] parvosata subsp. kistnae]|uniref:Uncharacterized protein n=1 Tax=[Actinomadura] parvosata subsp. kistnae TaxID=1909395 RepID=A0A1V0ABL7_9ACTN|nr:hypothetical protein [Nonomuraea sp. ATCC 55076]AQZ67573.1 hypothetical protein BKM31_44405 [Nonomuraea sp. ATCC 55076]SPL94149.1 unnamed protein product [Actinomadura parvosata subsp. kistnae]
MTIPAQNCTPLEDTPLVGTPADLTTITELRAELSQDVSALNDEIGGFRRQSNDHFSKLRGQIQDQHHSVHRRLTDLAQVIERLAKKLDT